MELADLPFAKVWKLLNSRLLGSASERRSEPHGNAKLQLSSGSGFPRGFLRGRLPSYLVRAEIHIRCFPCVDFPPCKEERLF